MQLIKTTIIKTNFVGETSSLRFSDNTEYHIKKKQLITTQSI